jgi:hypothetical protein
MARLRARACGPLRPGQLGREPEPLDQPLVLLADVRRRWYRYRVAFAPMLGQLVGEPDDVGIDPNPVELHEARVLLRRYRYLPGVQLGGGVLEMVDEHPGPTLGADDHLTLWQDGRAQQPQLVAVLACRREHLPLGAFTQSGSSSELSRDAGRRDISDIGGLRRAEIVLLSGTRIRPGYARPRWFSAGSTRSEDEPAYVDEADRWLRDPAGVLWERWARAGRQTAPRSI